MKIIKHLTVIILFLTILIPSLLYFYQYASNGFSEESKVWSDFGGYFGGIVTPVFAFYAYILGLNTLNETRKQKQLDGLLVSIKGFEEDLLKTCSMKTTCDIPLLWGNNSEIKAIKDLTVFPLSTLLFSDGIEWKTPLSSLKESLMFRIQPNGDIFQDRDIWTQAINSSQRLFSYVEQYRKHGGDKSMVEYYIKKYEVPYNRLKESTWKGIE